jgi:hypothetical protein
VNKIARVLDEDFKIYKFLKKSKRSFVKNTINVLQSKGGGTALSASAFFYSVISDAKMLAPQCIASLGG